MGMPVAPQFNQRDFRIRKIDVTAAANAAFDASDPALNVGTTVDADQAFRIRFNVETTLGESSAQSHIIQFSRNSGAYINMSVEIDEGPAQVSRAAAVGAPIYAASAYTDGTAATQLLGSDSPYVNGEVVESDNSSGAIAADDLDFFEVEYLVVIRRWFDTFLENADGDTFDFRLVFGADIAYTYDTNSGYDNIPRATLNIPTRYVGGTMVETPNRIGPFADANSNLYWFMESTSSANRVLLVKSTDGGDTWAQAATTGRPIFTDLECVDVVVEDNDILHIVFSDGIEVEYHEYNMSSAATNPDTWQTIDDSVSTGGNVLIGTQTCAIVHRPAESDFIIFYNDYDGGSTLDYAFYKIGVGGAWGTEQALATGDIHGISAVLGFDGSGNDLVHVVYADENSGTNGTLFHRSINNADTLSAAETVSTDIDITVATHEVPMTQVVHWTSGSNEKMMVVFRHDTNGYLFSSVVEDDGAPSTPIEVEARAVKIESTNPGGSRQSVANLVVDGTDVYVHWADLTTGDLFRTKSADGAAWDAETEEINGVGGFGGISWIRGTVFTHSSGNGGATVVGYIYDNGSLGGMGHEWYDEFVLRTPAVYPPFPRRKQTTVRM